MFKQILTYQSNKFDSQLVFLLPQVFTQSGLLESYPSICQEQISTSSTIEEEESSSELFQSQSSFHSEEESQPRSETSEVTPKRMIAQTNLQHSTQASQDFQESQSSGNRAIRRRRKRGEVNGYPTKNFLSNAKGPHFRFLLRQLGDDFVYSIKGVEEIKDKDGISMKDYEFLYKIKQFEKTFQKFFRLKILYRELMLSRSSVKARKVHMGKLSVYQEAFTTKVFERIN